MNPLNRRPQLLNVGFAVLVLGLALVSRIGNAPEEDRTLSEEVARTSVQSSLSSYTDMKPAFVARTLPARQLSSAPAPVVHEPLVVSAAGAYAQDLLNQTEFVAHNAAARWPIASITKLMTAVVAFEKIGAHKIVTMTATSTIGTEGLAGEFSEGEEVSVLDLVKAALVVSSNDAAAALAEFYFTDAFVAEMNRKAVSLGMVYTTFHDPIGLSPLNQATATDLAKLARYIFYTHPDIFIMSRQPEIIITDQKSGRQRTLRNINLLAGREDFIGGKTGYIDEAAAPSEQGAPLESSGKGGNLLSLFEYRGRPFLIVVFGADDRYVETERILKEITHYSHGSY